MLVLVMNLVCLVPAAMDQLAVGGCMLNWVNLLAGIAVCQPATCTSHRTATNWPRSVGPLLLCRGSGQAEHCFHLPLPAGPPGERASCHPTAGWRGTAGRRGCLISRNRMLGCSSPPPLPALPRHPAWRRSGHLTT